MATKKMQDGGSTTVKSKKGVTTKKTWGIPGSLADYKHVGKKGKTEVTLDRKDVTHTGKKGVTNTMRYNDNNYVVEHKGAKGTTTVEKDKNYNKTSVSYTSNKTGKTTLKIPGKKTVTYKTGGAVKKMAKNK